LIFGSLISITAFYLVSQREAYGRWRDAARYIPVLMAVGIGISVNNARAVIAGLFPGKATFRRTPKYALDDGGALASRRYRARRSLDTWIELALGVYFAGLVLAALADGLWGAVPFLALFAGGFLYTACASFAVESAAPAREDAGHPL
jgi:hypothetical protein